MRKDYITAKYTEKRFARRLCADAASRLQGLYEAVRNRDILSLIQVYAEGVDLMEASSQPNEHVRLQRGTIFTLWGSKIIKLGRVTEISSAHICLCL